ncbi:MAG: DUF4136 domain-containing protein [Planctomycetes bacterium]|nr:DUF4136 domain-containing protein [Planctomycetota bacterium]
MRRTLQLGILVVLGLLSACSSPKVITNVDPNADFDRYRTFGFTERLGTDSDDYQSLKTQFLKQAVARELEARGYSPADQPDLLVNFYLQSKEKIASTTTPSAYYGYRGYGGYGTWGGYAGYETTVTQYTEGTLNVDLVDSRRMQLVWEGAIVGEVTDEMRRELEKSIDDAVKTLFEKFPFTAPPPTN